MEKEIKSVANVSRRDVSEFLTAATVPNGRYVKGSMVLDYSNADIQVEDSNGDAQRPRQALDDPVDRAAVGQFLGAPRHHAGAVPALPFQASRT